MTQNETDLKQSRGTLVLQDCGSLQNILVKKAIYLLCSLLQQKTTFGQSNSPQRARRSIRVGKNWKLDKIIMVLSWTYF